MVVGMIITKAMLVAVMVLFSYAAIGSAVHVDIDSLLDSLTLEEKIGQMTQIDIITFMVPGTDIVDYDLMGDWIEKYKIGSILNSPFSMSACYNGVCGWNATQWRTLINRMQTFSQLTPAKIPLIYGIDSIHGATFVKEAALFPQSIAMAATFDDSFAYTMGSVTSKDTRAGAMPWIFAPVLGLGLQPLWARFPETFGEDPYLVSRMGVAAILGMQDIVKDGGIPTRTAACMKHFIAYSDPINGHDRSPVLLPDRSLRQLYIPAFKAAVDAGVMSAMESYNEIGGEPMVSSNTYLQTLLRQELNFSGMMVTDYAEIENLHNWHKVSASQLDAVNTAISETSIDMSMVPLDDSFTTNLRELVEAGSINISRIDASVRRILSLKVQLGLFDVPVPPIEDPLVDTVGQDLDWALSLNASLEAITLLKNENDILPLPSDSNILVAGVGCDSLLGQTGGWSMHWQGLIHDDEVGRGFTVLDGISSTPESIGSSSHSAGSEPNYYSFGGFEGGNIAYFQGPALNATNLQGVNMTLAENMAGAADVVVLCIGEGTYAEKPGDIQDLALSQGQADFVEQLALVGTPIVLVLIEGRPLLIHNAVEASAAVINAYVPGPMGGLAVAQVLSGVVPPSGRLPFTYPRFAGNIPYYYHHKPGDQCISESNPFDYVECVVEWPFRYGLSYTTFAYSNLQLSASEIDESGSIDVSVEVKNTGNAFSRGCLSSCHPRIQTAERFF